MTARVVVERVGGVAHLGATGGPFPALVDHPGSIRTDEPSRAASAALKAVTNRRWTDTSGWTTVNTDRTVFEERFEETRMGNTRELAETKSAV